MRGRILKGAGGFFFFLQIFTQLKTSHLHIKICLFFTHFMKKLEFYYSEMSISMNIRILNSTILFLYQIVLSQHFMCDHKFLVVFPSEVCYVFSSDARDHFFMIVICFKMTQTTSRALSNESTRLTIRRIKRQIFILRFGEVVQAFTFQV